VPSQLKDDVRQIRSRKRAARNKGATHGVDMNSKSTFVAKALVAIAFGAAVGYFVKISLAHDAERGRALTLDQYVADFAQYKARLQSSESSLAFTVGSMILLSLGLFGLYEFAAVILSATLGSFLGRREVDATR